MPVDIVYKVDIDKARQFIRTDESQYQSWGEDLDGNTSSKPDDPVLKYDKTIKAIKEAESGLNINREQAQASPYWDGPYTTGKKLNANAYLGGQEKFMMRRVWDKNPTQKAGKRVFIQLAVASGESHKEAIMRGSQALRLISEMKTRGETASVCFTWACTRFAGGRVTPYLEYDEIPDYRMLAIITSPAFFRTIVFADITRLGLSSRAVWSECRVTFDANEWKKDLIASGIATEDDEFATWKGRGIYSGYY